MSARGLLLAIGGPTASGKTALATELARRLGGEIVNADSRQVYLGMDIGTAKPSAGQRALVPNHLLDLVAPDQEFTLAHYVREAHNVIRAIQARGRLPLLVGGTGLYVRAVTKGYSVPEVPPDADLRRRLEHEAAEHGPGALLERLRLVDPEGARLIDGRNPRRLIRALEVSLSLGVPFSTLQRHDPPYSHLTIVLQGPYEMLYARADARFAAMLAEGFEAEVARLLGKGYSLDLPAMSALGYRELGRHLLGEIGRDDALAMVRHNTHAFIRRQRTWFRGEPDAHVLSIDRPDLAAAVRDLVDPWLADRPVS